jgi:16S rRNA (guanine(966)-N(2))-methyltransferase RsmD
MKTGSRNISSLRKTLRPTTGKVREALFNILKDRIEGSRFLDLYAGTGAVGLEALRRGASEVVFVEAGRGYTQKIRALIEKRNFSDRASIVTKKALPFVEWAELYRMTFDIVFLDPPYHTDEIIHVLSSIGRSHIMEHKALVVAEHFKKIQLPDQCGKLVKMKDYHYGDTVLTFYEMSSHLSKKEYNKGGMPHKHNKSA